MHNKWKTLIKQQKSLQQKIKNTKGIREFFTDFPEKSYMRDNISKKKVLIKECKTSTLRRYEKLLNKYFQLCSTPEERKLISDKLNEVITELNKRPDAIINHNK